MGRGNNDTEFWKQLKEQLLISAQKPRTRKMAEEENRKIKFLFKNNRVFFKNKKKNIKKKIKQ